ncbi:MAG TPA: hypothetical protein VK623_09250 [Flavobacterium sp.]|nr:hypothetical protein [Flavobacterium sp.]
MQTASFTGVIETLFYIIVFYYIFKYAMRLLLPVVLKKAVEKAEENLRNYDTRQYPNNDTFAQPNSKSDKPRETKKVGEYVDFEEIE